MTNDNNLRCAARWKVNMKAKSSDFIIEYLLKMKINLSRHLG